MRRVQQQQYHSSGTRNVCGLTSAGSLFEYSTVSTTEVEYRVQ